MNNNSKALIFDTNFIIEHSKDLNSVVAELNKHFEVFITQLSIDERISQQYLELKEKYNKITNAIDEYASIATITLKQDFEDREKKQRKIIQDNYEKLFCKNIISFSKSENTFSLIIDRVYKKIPPFLTGNKSSDKGFKDTILWLSLMDYFKNNKKFSSIIFVSNDSGFIENKSFLIKEFKEYTNSDIEIYKNEYLNEFLKKNEESINEDTSVFSLNFDELSQLRAEINENINSVCSTYYWNEYFEQNLLCATFNNLEYITLEQVVEMMQNLETVIKNNLFNTDLYVTDFMDSKIQFKNVLPIPIENIEILCKTYKELQKSHEDLLPQFYNVVMNRMNQNYQEPKYPEDIPF